MIKKLTCNFWCVILYDIENIMTKETLREDKKLKKTLGKGVRTLMLAVQIWVSSILAPHAVVSAISGDIPKQDNPWESDSSRFFPLLKEWITSPTEVWGNMTSAWETAGDVHELYLILGKEDGDISIASSSVRVPEPVTSTKQEEKQPDWIAANLKQATAYAKEKTKSSLQYFEGKIKGAEQYIEEKKQTLEVLWRLSSRLQDSFWKVLHFLGQTIDNLWSAPFETTSAGFISWGFYWLIGKLLKFFRLRDEDSLPELIRKVSWRKLRNRFKRK